MDLNKQTPTQLTILLLPPLEPACSSVACPESCLSFWIPRLTCLSHMCCVQGVWTCLVLQLAPGPRLHPLNLRRLTGVHSVDQHFRHPLGLLPLRALHSFQLPHRQLHKHQAPEASTHLPRHQPRQLPQVHQHSRTPQATHGRMPSHRPLHHRTHLLRLNAAGSKSGKLLEMPRALKHCRQLRERVTEVLLLTRGQRPQSQSRR